MTETARRVRREGLGNLKHRGENTVKGEERDGEKRWLEGNASRVRRYVLGIPNTHTGPGKNWRSGPRHTTGRGGGS